MRYYLLFPFLFLCVHFYCVLYITLHQSFKRRIYKLNDRRAYYYQLSHYRNDQVDTIAANKGKFVDPRVGYLVYAYLIRPDLFTKDILTIPTQYSTLLNWHFPAADNKQIANQSTNQVTSELSTDVEKDIKQFFTLVFF